MDRGHRLVTAKPLTDEDLNWMQSEGEEFAKEGRDHRPSIEFYDVPLRLIAEVRRLRSDKWLELAFDDPAWALDPEDERAEWLSILRKYRDSDA